MMVNTQELICKAFGYKEIVPIDKMLPNKKQEMKSVFGITKKNLPLIKVVTDNSSESCAMCGKVHSTGYVSVVSSEHLLNTMVSDTFNECYSISNTNFICEHCGFSTVAYGSPSKVLMGKKMLNCIVYSDATREDKFFSSTKENYLYEILAKPPEPPFVVLINSRNTVLENLVFTAKATLSKNRIIVNYGLENLAISPKEVFSAIKDAKRIATIFKIESSSDHIWNRQNDIKISLKKTLRDNADFIKEIGIFLTKYDRDCRLVSKMILQAYMVHHEDNTSSPKEAKSIKEESNTAKTLFDF